MLIVSILYNTVDLYYHWAPARWTAGIRCQQAVTLHPLELVIKHHHRSQIQDTHLVFCRALDAFHANASWNYCVHFDILHDNYLCFFSAQAIIINDHFFPVNSTVTQQAYYNFTLLSWVLQICSKLNIIFDTRLTKLFYCTTSSKRFWSVLLSTLSSSTSLATVVSSVVDCSSAYKYFIHRSM